MTSFWLVAARGLGNRVAEIISWTVLFTVIAVLCLSVWRQFNFLGPRGQIADSLGILPQWKFFALSTIKTRDDSFDDFHLLARLANDTSEAGAWQSLEWNEERKWFHILWNPYLRAEGEIQMRMMNVVNSGDAARTEAYQTSLSYLTLLRHCLDCVPVREGSAIQFAIATTRGRQAHPFAVRYLSAWHSE